MTILLSIFIRCNLDFLIIYFFLLFILSKIYSGGKTMYPEFPKVDATLKEALELLKTEKTMKDVFHSYLRNKNKIAVEYINDRGRIKHYKYKKLIQNAKNDASIINELLEGVAKNQTIVLKAQNSPKWVELFWAILMCGFKPLLVDARTPKENTINLIKQGKAVAIVTDDMYQYPVKKIGVDDVAEEKPFSGFEPTWENEVIFCSSGTTGDVKMMVYNGENIIHQICASIEMSKETKDLMYPDSMGKIKILAMVPFHHIFGFVAVFLWFSFYGKILVFPASNTPGDLQYICQKTGVTHIFSVPLLWDSTAKSLLRKAEMAGPERQALLQKMMAYNTGKMNKEEAGLAASNIVRKKVQNAIFGSKVRYCISGGGFLSQETLNTINGIGYKLYNGYGMTELGVTSVELSPDVNIRLLGSIGRPLHGVEYKIIEGGELVVKSPITHVREIIGGVERPASLDEEGYFHTGDIAEVDERGEYYLRGRIKDIIVNADGENIFPDELEIYFKDLPHVIHLCVLGIAKKNSKDEDVALVLELDNQVTDEDIEKIKEEVKGIKLPHGVKIANVFLSKGKLPLANNMKVKRFAIKKAIEAKTGEYLPIDKKDEDNTFEGFTDEVIKEILEPMRELFSKVLILPKFKIADDANWINDLGGDSMSYVELVRDAQDYFGIEFPEETLGVMATVNDFTIEVAKLKKMKKK